MLVKISTLVLLLATVAHCKQFLTDLEIDNHPCKPENLKKSIRYICDKDGNVICQKGWRNPDGFERVQILNPCLEPICNISGSSCIHGQCKEPDHCACEVGWSGATCDECITLPTCVHGKCVNYPFECVCEDGWTGANCDIAECENCDNGECIAPHTCVCNEGWTGQNCEICKPRSGCLNGFCDVPGTCHCNPHYEGYLCDKLICQEPCVHGVCDAVVKDGGEVETFCICDAGWKGPQCDQCRPYWNCPEQLDSSCVKPNDCLCVSKNVNDPDGLCDNPLLTHHEFHEGHEGDRDEEPNKIEGLFSPNDFEIVQLDVQE